MWPNPNINPNTGMLRTSEAEKRAIKDLLDRWKRWEEEDSDEEEEEEQREPPPKRWTSLDLVAKKQTGRGASGQRRSGKGQMKGSMGKMQPLKKVPSRDNSGRKHVGRVMTAGGFEH